MKGAVWRDIGCADHVPQRNLIVLGLKCGHRLMIRTDTPFGQSFLQTDWQAAQCYQCPDTNYGTGKHVKI